MQISGSRILLTGASGGLGQATARRLAGLGAHLTLTGRNVVQLEALADELGAATAEVIVADVRQPDDLARLAATYGDIDILIANAGRGGDLPFRDETSTNIDQIIDTNLRAPIQMATEFAQQKLQAASPGHIVLVGSLSGLAASPNTRLYNATKFGLRGFGLALRQDLHGTGIGVSVVAPGFIRDAGMFAESGMDMPGVVRTKSPDDVANGVISAIEKNRGEVFVAPTELRAAATLATVAPGLSERLQRIAGASRIVEGSKHP